MTGDERYRFLNDVVCAVTGEVRAEQGRPALLVVEAAEVVWEPPAE